MLSFSFFGFSAFGSTGVGGAGGGFGSQWARGHLDEQVIGDAVGRGDVDVEQRDPRLRSASARRPWRS